MFECQKRYSLELENGDGWCLAGVKNAAAWVERLAAIMQLEPVGANSLPNIIFCETEDLSSVKDSFGDKNGNPISLRGGKGWFVYDLKTMLLWRHERIPDVIAEIRNNENYEIEIINMWNALQPIYQKAEEAGGLPLHAALLEFDGRGIIIAAPGDTGKSTCCQRVPSTWNPLGDDETLVVLDGKKGYRAHPFPTWGDYLNKRPGKTWNVQVSIPASAIFFLEQSGSDGAAPIEQARAAVLVNRSARQVSERFWGGLDGEEKKKLGLRLFDNACRLAKAVPAFILRASANGKFWEEIEKVL